MALYEILYQLFENANPEAPNNFNNVGFKIGKTICSFTICTDIKEQTTQESTKLQEGTAYYLQEGTAYYFLLKYGKFNAQTLKPFFKKNYQKSNWSQNIKSVLYDLYNKIGIEVTNEYVSDKDFNAIKTEYMTYKKNVLSPEDWAKVNNRTEEWSKLIEAEEAEEAEEEAKDGRLREGLKKMVMDLFPFGIEKNKGKAKFKQFIKISL